MKIDDIMDMWDADSVIDSTNLSLESLNIPKLHAKYYRIYINEKLVHKKYDAQYKELKMEKYEFYTQGPTKEQLDMGWRLPPIGKILKQEVPQYLESDKDLINLSLKIGLQNEKIKFLESIIQSLTGRSFNIKNAIEFEKFKMGVG